MTKVEEDSNWIHNEDTRQVGGLPVHIIKIYPDTTFPGRVTSGRYGGGLVKEALTGNVARPWPAETACTHHRCTFN